MLDDFTIDFNQHRDDGEEEVSMGIYEDANYNRDNFEKEDEEVRQYLTRLDKSTTELSYLCQHMKWAQPTSEEKKSPLSATLYSSHVEVLVRVKNGNGVVISGDCTASPSKKEARRVASLFVLQKIYNSIPEVWKKFRALCEKNKGIQQSLTANNEEVFRKAKFEVLNLFDGEVKPKDKTEEDLKIEAYLDKICSFKNEVNLLIGKFKAVTAPEFTRDQQDELGLWPVEVLVYDSHVSLKAGAKDISKKKA